MRLRRIFHVSPGVTGVYLCSEVRGFAFWAPGKVMIRAFLKSHVRKYRDIIVGEARDLENFMRLLMKQRNTGSKWTKNEKAQLKQYLWGLAFYAPVLFVFLLPGGFLLIPLLAEAVDRRRRLRKPIRDDEQAQK